MAQGNKRKQAQTLTGQRSPSEAQALPGGPVQELLRQLPAMPVLIAHPLCVAEDHGAPAPPRHLLIDAARSVLAEARDAIRAGKAVPSLDALASQVRVQAELLQRPRLGRVINATGVVIHTNLGRAPLSAQAMARVLEVGASYSNLEYDVEEGERGSRQDLLEGVLCQLTGADAALVVNNNAAAVLLALSALASGKEVIVSRGELVEIGGSFRIPDILLQSGCRLKEVGSTNRTRVSDYARAITPDTGFLLKVHPSNFRMEGFTESVSGEQLSTLGRERQIPVMEDLGSGCLVELGPFGLPGEPTAAQGITSGIDLLSMSGDKLLGGPQAGILVGKKPYIQACRTHPLARALRIDKLSLAALEGTLSGYVAQRERHQVPVLEMLTRPLETLTLQAQALAEQLEGLEGLQVRCLPGSSRVGGGAFPERPLPTCVVAIRPATPEHVGGIEGLEARLRQNDPPIVARLREGWLQLDPRTLLGNDAELIVRAFARICAV